MTKDNIMKWAREAGFERVVATHPDGSKTVTVAPVPELEAFANLVAAHKAEVALAEAYRCGYKDGMEAAAVICENFALQQDRDVRDECAAAIRAKGTT